MSSDDKLAKAFDLHLKLEREALCRHLARCESPMEELLLLAFLRLPYVHQLVNRFAPLHPYLFATGPFNAGYSLQVPVEIDGQSYRLDFAIEGSSRVAVEVDGHDFHERTKEQAKRDKGRDRALTTAGWRVLRFTGSDVFKDAYSCAWQVLRLLDAAWGKDPL